MVVFLGCPVCFTLERDMGIPGASQNKVAPDVEVPSKALVQGRLKKSQILTELDAHLAHLTLFLSPMAFSDIPSCTSVLHHDIDVGGSPPIKQHAYRVNPDKRLRLKGEVEYMRSMGLLSCFFVFLLFS